jgi:hypothetical protein
MPTASRNAAGDDDMAIYSTTAQAGIDVNQVFYLDSLFPEYPAPPFLVGELAWGTDGSEWVFVTSTVAVPAGGVCLVSAVPGQWLSSPTGGTVATAPTGQLIGVQGGSAGTNTVAALSTTQTGSFYWLQRAGNCPNVSCAAATTANTTPLHSVATVPGQVSAAGAGVGTTYQINGMVISQAAGSVAGPNTAVLNYPVVGATN